MFTVNCSIFRRGWANNVVFFYMEKHWGIFRFKWVISHLLNLRLRVRHGRKYFFLFFLSLWILSEQILVLKIWAYGSELIIIYFNLHHSLHVRCGITISRPDGSEYDMRKVMILRRKTVQRICPTSRTSISTTTPTFY